MFRTMKLKSTTVEASSPSPQVFKRPIRPISFGELLDHTGFFVRVDTYRPRAAGTAIADFDVSVELSYGADPVDVRSATLEIRGCRLHQANGRFWISVPDNLSFPYPEDHKVFELSVFKDLCLSFPELMPPELIHVTEQLRREERNAEN
jgi:hypothetical protein